MKKLMNVFAATCATLALTCCSNPKTATYESTIVNEDGTITFLYKNDNAKEVFVDVQFVIIKKLLKNYLLQKKLLWSHVEN